MSIEQKIDTLTQAVVRLAVAMETRVGGGVHWEPSAESKAFTDAASERKVVDMSPDADEDEPVVEEKPKAKGKATKGKATKAKEVEPVADEDEDEPQGPTVKGVTVPSRSQLQDMVLTIVRQDKTKKDVIKGIIAEHGGKLIKDIPDDMLESLSDAIKELKQ